MTFSFADAAGARNCLSAAAAAFVCGFAADVFAAASLRHPTAFTVPSAPNSFHPFGAMRTPLPA